MKPCEIRVAGGKILRSLSPCSQVFWQHWQGSGLLKRFGEGCGCAGLTWLKEVARKNLRRNWSSLWGKCKLCVLNSSPNLSFYLGSGQSSGREAASSLSCFSTCSSTSPSSLLARSFHASVKPPCVNHGLYQIYHDMWWNWDMLHLSNHSNLTVRLKGLPLEGTYNLLHISEPLKAPLPAFNSASLCNLTICCCCSGCYATSGILSLSLAPGPWVGGMAAVHPRICTDWPARQLPWGNGPNFVAMPLASTASSWSSCVLMFANLLVCFQRTCIWLATCAQLCQLQCRQLVNRWTSRCVIEPCDLTMRSESRKQSTYF